MGGVKREAEAEEDAYVCEGQVQCESREQAKTAVYPVTSSSQVYRLSRSASDVLVALSGLLNEESRGGGAQKRGNIEQNQAAASTADFRRDRRRNRRLGRAWDEARLGREKEGENE